MVRSMLRHLSGNTTLRFTALSRWNLSKFVVIKHFRWESLHLEPSCCLDVLVYMLNWVFWWDILLEIDLKCWAQNGYVQRYHPWALRRLLTPKKKTRNGANLKLRLALRAGGVITSCHVTACVEISLAIFFEKDITIRRWICNSLPINR